jgi:hypothetical protein
LFLEGLYSIPANLVLNTPLPSRLVNRHPEKVRIDWSLAVSPWPGLVYLRGVETEGRSRAIEWRARIGSVTASFRLLPLADRTVHLTRVRAEGVDYRQRPRPAPGEPPNPGADDWPPFAEMPNPPGPAPGSREPKRDPGPPWTIRADRILCDVEQLWIGRYRVEGPARVDARMTLVARGPLEFPRLDYRLESGDLVVGQEKLFEGFRLEAKARVAPFVPRGKKPGDVVRALSGDFDVDARNASVDFLDVYFRKAPDLQFSRRGPVRMHLKLDAGRLLPGSRLDVQSDRIDTLFLGQRLTGSGRIGAEVDAGDGTPRSRLEAVLDEFQIARAGSTEPFAHGSGFRVVATSASLDLADPFDDVHVEIDLPEAIVPDLSVYNVYLPARSHFSILSGRGRLGYHFVADEHERSLRGEMTFAMNDVAMRFEDTTLKGDVRIHTRLRDGDPAGRRFDISGTRIEIRSADPPWKGRIGLPTSKMSFTEPMRIEARAEVTLQDTRPLVAVFDAYRDVSRLLERLMTIRDVRGGANLKVGDDSVEINDLEIDGKGFRSLADLSFGEGGRDGILYIRLHGISVGLKLMKGEKDLKIIRPLRWFEQARAERRAAAGRAPR